MISQLVVSTGTLQELLYILSEKYNFLFSLNVILYLYRLKPLAQS